MMVIGLLAALVSQDDPQRQAEEMERQFRDHMQQMERRFQEERSKAEQGFRQKMEELRKQAAKHQGEHRPPEASRLRGGINPERIANILRKLSERLDRLERRLNEMERGIKKPKHGKKKKHVGDRIRDFVEHFRNRGGEWQDWWNRQNPRDHKPNRDY